MKPIAIFRFAANEGAGYFATFLNDHAIPWQMIRIDEGDSVPRNAADYSALVLMGGPMSVNDPLNWIYFLLPLLRDAVANDIPLLGHCLGAQLIAKALGGVVTQNPQPEFGWGKVDVAENAVAQYWFGEYTQFDAFHWHGETFSLPVGATPILSSPYCAHQGFAIGKHLALQCHIEMESNMIVDWCQADAAALAQHSALSSVQSAVQMQAESPHKLAELHQVAYHVYRQWLHGLARH